MTKAGWPYASLIDTVYLPLFQKEGEKVLKSFISQSIPRQSFLSAYKNLPPIEELPNEEKVGWRKYVNELLPNTTPEYRLEAIKILYTIGTLTN